MHQNDHKHLSHVLQKYEECCTASQSNNMEPCFSIHKCMRIWFFLFIHYSKLHLIDRLRPPHNHICSPHTSVIHQSDRKLILCTPQKYEECCASRLHNIEHCLSIHTCMCLWCVFFTLWNAIHQMSLETATWSYCVAPIKCHTPEWPQTSHLLGTKVWRMLYKPIK
jgi:hypothetical protein